MLARSSSEASVGCPTEMAGWGKQWTLYNFADSYEMNRVPVSHAVTGEFIPASERLFGSDLWRAKTSKSCSPASGPIPQESRSATKYFYRSPIATTACFVLISNTSACQTI